jgi:hypothetical protein
VLLDGLRLIQPLQGTIVAFIETPAALDRSPHAVGRVQNQPQRADRALQHRRKGDLRVEIFAL